jgi:branched-chain amino acid transport system permease protein
VQLVANALVLAALYVLLGIGVVLVYRASRVFNFAHGDVMMAGGYALWVGLAAVPAIPALAIPVALLAGFLIGAGIYLLTLRPLAGYPAAAAILVTVAVGILLRAIATLVWGPQPLYPASAARFQDVPVRLPGGAVLSTVDLASIGAAALVFFGILALLHRTPLGVRMRAAAEKPSLAAYAGIDLHRMLSLTWGLAAATAALGAIFFTARINLQPEIWIVGLKAFAPPLIGGMDSVKGLLPGALIVALVEVAAGQFVDPILLNVAPFAVVLVALWIRPWGLYGSPEEVERI